MAGVDDERLFCVAPDNGAVYFKGTDGKDFNVHAGENRQGGCGIKAGTAKMSPSAVSFMGSVVDLEEPFPHLNQNFNRIRWPTT